MLTLKSIVVQILRWCLTIMILGMTLLILGQIFWRYVIEAPFVWSEELSLLLMTWITFLGSPLLLMRQEHLGIEVFVEKLPESAARLCLLAGQTLILIFCLFLTYGAWILVEKTRNSITPGLQISVAWQYASGLVGGILMSVVTIEKLALILSGRDISELQK
jgi:TRAP-type C4-dicarboxylate transport system permease small subunit